MTTRKTALTVRGCALLWSALFLAAFARAQAVPPHYILGPNDQIAVSALHVPEMDGKPLRLDASGGIDLPLIGRVKAAGLTVDELRSRLRERLDEYIRDPEVSVEVVAFHSQSVSVMGAVKNPGVFYLEGPTTLATAISLAGGISPEGADAVEVSRAKDCGFPLPGSRPAGAGGLSASLRVSPSDGAKLADILVCPNDVLSVPRARLVYVLGEVHKPGGFLLRDGESLSALQALALAEGPERNAGIKHARLLRPAPGQGVRSETEIDLGKILSGQAADIPLTADDVLYVPSSASRSAAVRGLEAALEMGTGVVIWHR
ncbi:MAG: polysaccharide biosynthesis/export family protein [Bryobacteraceae bacterium]